ncbi:MAG: hypothetical protein ACRDGK_00490 [Actinomycetota bacterium]
MVSVRFSISAWHAFRSLSDDDPTRTEIERIVFDLVERGEAPAGARASEWPWGTGTTPGYAIELSTVTGFVACASLVDPHTQETFIGVVHIVIER